MNPDPGPAGHPAVEIDGYWRNGSVGMSPFYLQSQADSITSDACSPEPQSIDRVLQFTLQSSQLRILVYIVPAASGNCLPAELGATSICPPIPIPMP